MAENPIAKREMFQTFKVAVIHNVSNIAYYGPEPALVKYLKKRNVATLLYVQHPYYGDRASRAKYYEANVPERVTKLFSPRVRNHWLPTTIYNALSTVFFVLNTNARFDVYIGSGELNALVGLILKKMGRVETVVYLSHTYGEASKPIINPLVLYCARSVDFVWSLSRRLVQIWQRQGVSDEANIWVPVGVHFEEIRCPVTPPKLDGMKRLVYVGILSPGKGVELIIEALPTILNRVSKVELIIIGGGPLEEKLKEACRRSSLESQVKFLGYMKYSKLMEFLPKCHVGLAPYEPTVDNTALTTDPLKPKLYMACGLPVIITGFSETASEVKESGSGLVIRYDNNELAEAVVRLLRDTELFKRCSENAVKVAYRYEWSKNFDRAFHKIFQALAE